MYSILALSHVDFLHRPPKFRSCDNFKLQYTMDDSPSPVDIEIDDDIDINEQVSDQELESHDSYSQEMHLELDDDVEIVEEREVEEEIAEPEPRIGANEEENGIEEATTNDEVDEVLTLDENVERIESDMEEEDKPKSDSIEEVSPEPNGTDYSEEREGEEDEKEEKEGEEDEEENEEELLVEKEDTDRTYREDFEDEAEASGVESGPINETNDYSDVEENEDLEDELGVEEGEEEEGEEEEEEGEEDDNEEERVEEEEEGEEEEDDNEEEREEDDEEVVDEQNNGDASDDPQGNDPEHKEDPHEENEHDYNQINEPSNPNSPSLSKEDHATFVNEANSTVTKDEQTVPIIIDVADTEFLLVPFKAENSSIDVSLLVPLFDSSSVLELPIEEFFGLMRHNEDLNEIYKFSVDEELVLLFPQFDGLHLTEDNVYSREVTFNDFLSTFERLAENTVSEKPLSMACTLTSQTRFITKFNGLAELIREKKGFESVAVQHSPEKRPAESPTSAKKRQRLSID